MEELGLLAALAFTGWWIVGTTVFYLMRKHRKKTWQWMLVYGPVVYFVIDLLPRLALALGMQIIYRNGNVYIAFCTHDASGFRAICRNCGRDTEQV